MGILDESVPMSSSSRTRNLSGKCIGGHSEVGILEKGILEWGILKVGILDVGILEDSVPWSSSSR